MAQISEGLLTTDKYNKPMLLKDKDALAILLLRLLVMTPGTNPLHPELGVDIRGRYEYCGEDDLDDLNTEIETQISIYLPSYITCTVEAEIRDNRSMGISITIDDMLFKYSTATGSDLATDEISVMSEE